jgi:hypothetical protein
MRPVGLVTGRRGDLRDGDLGFHQISFMGCKRSARGSVEVGHGLRIQSGG